MITIEASLYNKMPNAIKACCDRLSNPGSDEVLEGFPQTSSTRIGNNNEPLIGKNIDASSYALGGKGIVGHDFRDSGSAARFFYCAKSSKSERNEGLPTGTVNDHPTVKPIKLMQYLCKLIVPPGGTVLDPFCGSGSTLKAANQLGFKSIGIELDKHSCEIADARTKGWGLLGVVVNG